MKRPKEISIALSCLRKLNNISSSKSLEINLDKVEQYIQSLEQKVDEESYMYDDGK